MVNVTNHARDLGGSLAIFLKLLMAAAFICLAFIDRNTTFLTENPGKVIGEAILVGAAAVIAFIGIAFNRRVGLGNKSMLITLGIIFLVFFAVHFFFELSGFNEIEETTGSRKLGEFEGRAKKSILAKIFVLFVAFLFISFTLCGWDAPSSTWSGWRVKGPVGFIIEGIWFAIVNAAPFIMIHMDRGGSFGDAMIEFGKMVFLFFVGHVVAQYGALYRETGLMTPSGARIVLGNEGPQE